MTTRAPAITALLLGLAASGGAGAPAETFSFGAAGRVTLYRPAGSPQQVVLFVSGDGGWNLGVVGMAEHLRGLGALVVGIDIRAFFANLQRSSAACAYAAGDLEELSRALQLRFKLPEYKPPILVGYSSGATLVYAVLASAPPETFAGGISLGFCPDIQITKPLCKGRSLMFRRRAKGLGYDLDPVALAVPWVVLQGEIDRVCDPPATRAFVDKAQGRLVSLPKVGHGFSVTRNWEPQFVEAYRSLAASLPEPPRAPAAGALDLPLEEVPATKAGPDLMAVILTGDGGWAEIDKAIAASLAARGIPVVGWNSLRYYWRPRTPEAAALDLDRLLRHYLAAWGKSRALVVGYSFGADVAPFLVGRLPPATGARVAGLALLGLSRNASFEFHVTSWLGGGGEPRYSTAKEIEGLGGLRVTCIHGQEESDSACRALPAGAAHVVALPGGHHFGGDYDRLGQALLRAAQPGP